MGRRIELMKQFSFLKRHKMPLPPPFPKGEKVESSTVNPPKAPLPLKKGGREGFLGRPFQNAKVLRIFRFPPGEKKNGIAFPHSPRVSGCWPFLPLCALRPLWLRFFYLRLKRIWVYKRRKRSALGMGRTNTPSRAQSSAGSSAVKGEG